MIRNLCKSFAGKPVLRDFSAVLPVGQVTGLMAPSGAGKTTLARCLCGLMKEQAGTILWDGSPLGRKERRRKCRSDNGGCGHIWYSRRRACNRTVCDTAYAYIHRDTDAVRRYGYIRIPLTDGGYHKDSAFYRLSVADLSYENDEKAVSVSRCGA